MVLSFKSLIILLTGIILVPAAHSSDCSKFIGLGGGNPFDPLQERLRYTGSDYFKCHQKNLKKMELEQEKQLKQLRNMMQPKRNQRPNSLVKPIPNGKIYRFSGSGFTTKYHKKCEHKKDYKLRAWCRKFHRGKDYCSEISENRFPNNRSMRHKEMKRCMNKRNLPY